MVLNAIYAGNCLDLLPQVESRSIALALMDLPYGVTDCRWDRQLSLPSLWAELKRVLKPNGVAIFTAVQPFTTDLINANPAWFKYSYVWIKRQAANFQLAKKMPLKKHEDVLVFYTKTPTYLPQMRRGEAKFKRSGPQVYQKRKSESYLASNPANLSLVKSDLYYPTTLLDFPGVSRNRSLHRTQKPVGLYRFLIETYTRPGETVIDPCIGVGSALVAAKEAGRQFIGFELDRHIFQIARNRLQDVLPP